MRQFRVLFVIGQLSIGGTELQLVQLASGLRRDRFELLVVCLSGTFTSLAARFQENNIPLVLLDREGQGRLVSLWKLAQIIRDFRPDIVHAFGYASRAAIPSSKFFSSSKNIVSIRNEPVHIITWLDKLVNSFADYALANFQKASTPLDFGFRGGIPVKVIYNGINLQKFDIEASNKTSLLVPRPPLGTKIICTVARMHPQKRLDVLLDAFAALMGKMNNVQLWLVGDGQEKQNLKERAAHLGIDANVVFYGQQDNVPAILGCAHLGVLSSYYEGLPNAIIEYMAARLPVVATDVGGVNEVVINGETGLLVLPENVQGLAKAMLVILRDPEMAHRMGEAGRKRVEACFTVERMVAETEHVYFMMLSENQEHSWRGCV